MESTLSRWLGIGATLLALAVMTGAFGAHGLKGRLDDYGLEIWHKAVFYHFLHALGIVLMTLLAKTELVSPNTGSRISQLLLFGVIVFSGSLYTLALTSIKWLGAITPIGGTAFIAAWIWLAVHAFRR